MKIMLTLIALVIVCAAKPASAQTDLILGGWSYHLDREKGYNETHYSFGATVNDYTLMYYKNSGGHDSVALGKDIWIANWGGVKIGTTPVIVTSYTDGGEPVPMVFATARHDIGGCWGAKVHTAIVVTKLMFTCSFGDTKLSDWRPPSNNRWAVGYGYGTLGGSANIHYKINDNLAARVNVSSALHKWDDTWDHWDDGVWLWQNEALHTKFYGINLDYAPWGHKDSWLADLIVYGGVSYNHSTYETTYNVYGHESGACGVVRIVGSDTNACPGDKLYGDVDWSPYSGAFGFRYGNPFRDTGWSWTIDVGVQTLHGINGVAEYVGKGDVTEEQLTAFEDKERAKYRDEWKVAPRAQIELTYNF